MTHDSISVFAQQKTQSALGQLSSRLRQARQHPDDAESIHDLRVAIRRFDQCLETFEDLFDPSVGLRFRKGLRKVMNLCGEIRNFDIARELFRAAGLPDDDSTYKRLKKGRKQAERKLAQSLSKKRWIKLAKRHPIRLHVQAKAATHWDLDSSVAENTRKLLPPMCLEFFAAGEKAAAERGDYAALHRFRLSVKRFRYTLELFRELYGKTMELRLDELRELQTRLGDINDCRATLELVGKKTVAGRLVGELIPPRDEAFWEFWRKTFAGQNVPLWIRGFEKGPETARRRRKSSVVVSSKRKAPRPSVFGG